MHTRILLMVLMLACANTDSSSEVGGNSLNSHQGGSTMTQMSDLPSKDSYSWSECQRYFVSESNDFGFTVPVECEMFFFDKGRDPENSEFLPSEEIEQTFCEMQ